MTKTELFERLSSILQDIFDIPAEKIRLEARLYEDLDVDSIDAVDMIAQLRPLLGKRLQPDAFKSVRTLNDVVETVYGLLNDPTT